MIEIEFVDNKPTLGALNILNAAVRTAFTENNITLGDDDNIDWDVSFMDVSDDDDNCFSVPVINAKVTKDDGTHRMDIQAVGTWDGKRNVLELQKLNLYGGELNSLIKFEVTPMNEMYIMNDMSEATGIPIDETSELDEPVIKDDYYDMWDDVDLEEFPDIFYSKLALDMYMRQMAEPLENSIIYWMNTNNIPEVAMDSENIKAPKLLTQSIKRVFLDMDNDRVMLELTNGIIEEYRRLVSSIKIEICNEILSIVHES